MGIKVKYIGRKPFAIDNVAKSGKTWTGHGTVQEVTAGQAKILTSYRDQWALADDADAAELDKPVMIETEGADGATVHTDPAELHGPVEKMTVPQLLAYAQSKYGKTLTAKHGRKQLLDEVVALAGKASP